MKARPLLGDGLLAFDIAILRKLQAAGHLRGLRPLDSLVRLRRARSYGEGPRPLVLTLARLEREALDEPPAASTAGPCSDCKGLAWRLLPEGGAECTNCGNSVPDVTRGAG